MSVCIKESKNCFVEYALSKDGRLRNIVWKPWLVGTVRNGHKVLTYVEYRAVSGAGLASSNILTPTPSPPSECVLPPHQWRRVHIRRAVRGWGSIFWKTPDIGFASYSLIPLRVRLTGSGWAFRPENPPFCDTLHTLPRSSDIAKNVYSIAVRINSLVPYSKCSEKQHSCRFCTDLDWHSLLWINAHGQGILTIFINYHPQQS